MQPRHVYTLLLFPPPSAEPRTDSIQRNIPTLKDAVKPADFDMISSSLRNIEVGRTSLSVHIFRMDQVVIPVRIIVPDEDLVDHCAASDGEYVAKAVD